MITFDKISKKYIKNIKKLQKSCFYLKTHIKLIKKRISKREREREREMKIFVVGYKWEGIMVGGD